MRVPNSTSIDSVGSPSTAPGTSGPAPHRRRSMWVAAAAGAVLLLAPLAACGGDSAASEVSGDPGAQSGDRGSGVAGSDPAAAFQECLAENGIELGAPGGAPADGATPTERPDQDAMAEAQAACGDLMPQGGPGAGGARGAGGLGSEELAAWTACLSDNGVEVTRPAGPDSAGGPPGAGELPAERTAPEDGTTPFGLDTSDPEVAAAVAACADLEPEIGGPPAATGEGVTGDGDVEGASA
ncbi:MAG: hypothetical protein R2714_14590 [Microthrixaceae bacterium]